MDWSNLHRIREEMVFQSLSWVCTWLRVGWLSTNWRLVHGQRRKSPARSRIHPIQACAPAPAYLPCFNSLPSFFCTWEGFHWLGPPFRDFPAHTTQCHFRCRRSANTRSSSVHTDFNLQNNFILGSNDGKLRLCSSFPCFFPKLLDIYLSTPNTISFHPHHL